MMRRCEKYCLEYVCWNCLHTWITDVSQGPACRCPNCNSGNVANFPVPKAFVKEWVDDDKKDINRKHNN